MIYPYIVKRNGVYYEAGQDVPAFAPVKIEQSKEVEKPKQEQSVTYTKTDINRMNKAELVVKATEIGVKDAEEMSGNALKDKLIEYYGL